VENSFAPVQFGASFFDDETGARIFVLHPTLHPTFWQEYLQGAAERYSEYGVEGVLDERLRSGATTDVFWLAMVGDTAMAGARGQLIRHPDDARALDQFVGHPDQSRLRARVLDAIVDGVVEGSSVWCRRGAPAGLLSLIGSCSLTSTRMLGARWCIGTASEQALGMWVTAGAEIDDGGQPAVWPSPEYQTRFLWFDVPIVGTRMDPAQFARYEEIWRRLQTPRIVAASETPSGTLGTSTDAAAAEVIDDTTPEGRERIDFLMSNPSIRVVDYHEEMTSGLAELLPEPSSTDLTPRWVHYPWRGVVARALGAPAFRRLRLDRNRNKITLEEQRTFAQLRVGVVGLSVGQVIAHTLAMEGLVGELRLADFDVLELSNLNRIPSSILDLGLNKAVSAARRIAELDPYLQVSIHQDGVTEENVESFVDGLDVIIEECDSLDIKVLVREHAQRQGVPVIMVTSDRGLIDVERFDLEPDRPLLHGLAGPVDTSDLAGLESSEKIEFALKIIQPHLLSPRAGASMVEIDHQLATWPQLAGDIVQGAALVAAAVRRLGLGQELPSGRIRADIEQTLDRLDAPTPTPAPLGQELEIIEPAPTELLSRIAWFAGRAPSGGNAQPWRFSTDGTSFTISAENAWSVRMDVELRGTYVAIGAALLNARIAASEAASLGPHTLFPDPADPTVVARLDLGDQLDVDLASLAGAVEHRATDRRTDQRVPLPEGSLDLLRQATRHEGAELVAITEAKSLDMAGQILGRADRVRFLSSALHGEMMSELRWPEDGIAEDGIEVDSLGLDGTQTAILRLLRRSDVMDELRSWGGGAALGEPAIDAVAASSALMAVVVPGNRPVDYVTGGGAVGRMWLEAHRLGIGVHPWAPPFLYATDRSHYESLVNKEFIDESEVLAADLWKVLSIPSGSYPALLMRVGCVPGTVPPNRRRQTSLDLRDSIPVNRRSGVR